MTVNCQEIDLSLKLVFCPGIQEVESQRIDILIDVLDANGKKIDDVQVNSYPPIISRLIDNPTNEDVYFKIRILSPNGWAVIQNPTKYNKHNRRITLRRIDDIYFKQKKMAENSNSISLAIETYDNMLKNKFYTTESQKFEILKNMADLQIQSKEYQNAIAEYIRISNEIDMTKIGENRKKAYLNSFFNTILKAGDYNNLHYPKNDFATVIKKDSTVTIDSWTIFSKTFDKLYPNTIKLSDDVEALAIDKIDDQFKQIGKKLKTFN
jgi:hypothetical protein